MPGPRDWIQRCLGDGSGTRERLMHSTTGPLTPGQDIQNIKPQSPILCQINFFHLPKTPKKTIHNKTKQQKHTQKPCYILILWLKKTTCKISITKTSLPFVNLSFHPFVAFSLLHPVTVPCAKSRFRPPGSEALHRGRPGDTLRMDWGKEIFGWIPF